MSSLTFNWCGVSLYTYALVIFGFFVYLCHLNSYITHEVCKEHDALKSVYDYVVGKPCRYVTLFSLYFQVI